MNLNRKNNGATTINISNNVAMKVYYYDLTKENFYNKAPDLYLSYKKTAVFNVVLFTNNKKQKKKVKNHYYTDHVGKGNVRDLIDARDKIYEIISQLKEHEALTIQGADERRIKIYKHYISKDSRFDDCAIYYEWVILFFNPRDRYWMDAFVSSLITESEKDIFKCKTNKKIMRKRNKKWKEICR